MTDEPEKSKDNEGWIMPDPVFRSSQGYDPRKGREFQEEDLPDKEPDETDTDELPAADNEQKVRAKAETVNKGGCLSTVAFFVGIISLSIAIILGLLLYFLYFYVPPPPATF